MEKLNLQEPYSSSLCGEVRVEAASSLMLPEHCATPLQTHTLNYAVATAPDEVFYDTDALITFTPGLAVGVRTADCVPIVLSAPDIGAVAAVHAGWRGTLGGIAEKVADFLIKKGADPRLMHAAMGPCICVDCYEVDENLGRDFERAGFGEYVLRNGNEKPHLDLPGINSFLLSRRGLIDQHISMPPACTREDTRWPSWRREPGCTERLYTWVAMVKCPHNAIKQHISC